MATYLGATNSGKSSNVNTSFGFLHTIQAGATITLVFVCGYDDSVTQVVCNSVSGSVNGAYTPITGSTITLTGAYGSVKAFYKLNPTAGAETITCTFAGKTSNADATAMDWSGTHASSPIAASNTFTNSGGTTTATLASGTAIAAQFISDNIDPVDTSITTGTEVSEDDLGSAQSITAYRLSTTTIVMTDIDSNVAAAVGIALADAATETNQVMMVIGNMG